MTQQLQTGTTTLGILCKDGVLLAADKRATAGHKIFSEGVDKVWPINEQMAITMAGSVVSAKQLTKIISAECKLMKLRLGRQFSVREVANLLGSMTHSNNYKTYFSEITHFVLGGKNDDGTFALYDIFMDGSVHQIKKYVCSGSGSPYAEGFLETAYKQDMSVQEATTIAKRALSTSMTKDSASGNGADLYKITKNGVEKVETIVLTTVLP